MTAVIRNSFLASVLAQPRGGRINNANSYRRYRANVRTSALIGGNEDSRMTQISYEIGRVSNTKGQALARPGDNALLVDAAYPTAGALAEDFVGLAKKFTNFSASFEFSALAGVVERLARGLAATSIYDDVDSTDLRAGRALNINALGTYDGPVNSLTNTVFIPRLVNSSLTGDVFAVLVNAVAGEGATVATDVIELDAITRQPVVPLVDAAGLPRAIVDALRLLASNMIASDQGPLFALAFTRGLHRTLSVVGHTDEGGITRDLLRTANFGVPFGGIHYGLEPYAGIPALSSNNATDIAVYVDSLALTSAALVAHCDPGETYDGRWLPTFYLGTSADDPTVRPGDDQEGTAAMADRNRAQLLANLPKFADLYVPALGRLFAAEGDTRVGTAFLRASCSLLGMNNRHLRYASVAPWFWIEPTSLLPHDFAGTPAEEEGFASHGGRDSLRTKPAWEDIVAAGPGDTAFSGYHASFRGARASWFFLHWLGNPSNGLGAISVRQLDPNAIIHPGPNTGNPQVRDRVEAGDPWTGYLWTRGQSPFPAPGELLNLSGSVGFFVKHVTFDDEGIPTVEHVPTRNEFLDTSVTIAVGRPVGIPNGASNNPGADVRRAKTRAARELSAASARARLFGRPDVAEMATLTTAPVLRNRGPATIDRDPREQEHGGVDRWGRATTAGGEGAAQATRQPTGNANAPVPQHNPVRYPQVPRPAGNQPGGGGPGLPPAPPAPPAGLAGNGDDSDDDDQPPQPVAPAGGSPPRGTNSQ